MLAPLKTIAVVLPGAHPYIARALIVFAIFLIGYVEGAVFKLRRSAIITWFWGLAALVASVVCPWTKLSIIAGVVAFALGLSVLILISRNWKRKANT